MSISSSDAAVVNYAEAVEGVITFTTDSWFQDQTIQLNNTGYGDAVLTLSGSAMGDYDVEDYINYYRSPRPVCDRDEGVSDPNECECPNGVPIKCEEQCCSSSEEHCSFITGTPDQSNMDPGATYVERLQGGVRPFGFCATGPKAARRDTTRFFSAVLSLLFSGQL